MKLELGISLKLCYINLTEKKLHHSAKTFSNTFYVNRTLIIKIQTIFSSIKIMNLLYGYKNTKSCQNDKYVYVPTCFFP